MKQFSLYVDRSFIQTCASLWQATLAETMKAPPPSFPPTILSLFLHHPIFIRHLFLGLPWKKQQPKPTSLRCSLFHLLPLLMHRCILPGLCLFRHSYLLLQNLQSFHRLRNPSSALYLPIATCKTIVHPYTRTYSPKFYGIWLMHCLCYSVIDLRESQHGLRWAMLIQHGISEPIWRPVSISTAVIFIYPEQVLSTRISNTNPYPRSYMLIIWFIFLRNIWKEPSWRKQTRPSMLEMLPSWRWS